MEILYEVPGEVRVVVFDATVRENHGVSAVATEHPVARGANISDHVRPERRRLSAECHVTNTPLRSPNVDGASGEISALELSTTRRQFSRYAKAKSGGGVDLAETEETAQTVQANVLQFSTDFDRVQTVYDLLDLLCTTGTEITVVTSLRQYDSMVIVDVGAPRDAGSRNAVLFTLEMVEISFAEMELVGTPEPLETRAERRNRRGSQGAEEEEGESRSLAAAMVEDWGGVNLINSTRPNGNSLFR